MYPMPRSYPGIPKAALPVPFFFVSIINVCMYENREFRVRQRHIGHILPVGYLNGVMPRNPSHSARND